MNIGICDDNDEVRQSIFDLCKEISKEENEIHSCIVFKCGEEVLNYCKQKDSLKIDILFLDIEMPGIDGIELKNLFRIPTLMVYIVNPIMLGFILASNWVSTGEILYFARILIPHSIFEVPAIVMACSMGIKGKAGRADFKEGRLLANSTFIFIFLIIAATIESTISVSLI